MKNSARNRLYFPGSYRYSWRYGHIIGQGCTEVTSGISPIQCCKLLANRVKTSTIQILISTVTSKNISALLGEMCLLLHKQPGCCSNNSSIDATTRTTVNLGASFWINSGPRSFDFTCYMICFGQGLAKGQGQRIVCTILR